MTPPEPYDTLGEEVRSMNWLRNPFGLCNWAEDNFCYVGAKSDTELYYVVNNWAYDDSNKVDRKLFKSVVDGYWRVISKLSKGYFFFDVHSYIQFLEPKMHFIPREPFMNGESRIKNIVHLPDKIGLPMQYMTKDVITLSLNDDQTDGILQRYKDWFLELVKFAEELQDENLEFYCSN
jgi:hypothetical protein